MIDPTYSESIAINWYFLMVSCVVLTITGTILVEKYWFRVSRFPRRNLPNSTLARKEKNCLRRKTRVLKWQVLRHCFF
ncbi:MAG: AbgT family transporter [Lachnospiraceae bacterium]|nr:AbgT family transporter [Lachnospiraceae bacterium]